MSDLKLAKYQREVLSALKHLEHIEHELSTLSKRLMKDPRKCWIRVHYDRIGEPLPPLTPEIIEEYRECEERFNFLNKEREEQIERYRWFSFLYNRRKAKNAGHNVSGWKYPQK